MDPHAVREDSPRLLDPGGHQERRPVDGVKAQDVLTHDVQGRPEFRKAILALLLLIAETDRRDVIRQGVEPDVHCVVRIIGNRNAPTHRRLETTH